MQQLSDDTVQNLTQNEIAAIQRCPFARALSVLKTAPSLPQVLAKAISLLFTRTPLSYEILVQFPIAYTSVDGTAYSYKDMNDLRVQLSRESNTAVKISCLAGIFGYLSQARLLQGSRTIVKEHGTQNQPSSSNEVVVATLPYLMVSAKRLFRQLNLKLQDAATGKISLIPHRTLNTVRELTKKDTIPPGLGTATTAFFSILAIVNALAREKSTALSLEEQCTLASQFSFELSKNTLKQFGIVDDKIRLTWQRLVAGNSKVGSDCPIELSVKDGVYTLNLNSETKRLVDEAQEPQVTGVKRGCPARFSVVHGENAIKHVMTSASTLVKMAMGPEQQLPIQQQHSRRARKKPSRHHLDKLRVPAAEIL